MLFFRAEEHVDRWCGQWDLPRGATMSLDRAWRLARAWFQDDRGAEEWRRPAIEEVESLFASLDFRGPFWQVRS